jgi:hypothetical protein
MSHSLMGCRCSAQSAESLKCSEILDHSLRRQQPGEAWGLQPKSELEFANSEDASEDHPTWRS